MSEEEEQELREAIEDGSKSNKELAKLRKQHGVSHEANLEHGPLCFCLECL